MNKFNIGDRVSMEWFDYVKVPCLQKAKGTVKEVKKGGLLIIFDIPQEGQKESWITAKLCKRLVKVKPRYIHVEKSLVEDMYEANAHGKGLTIWEGKTEDNKFYNLKIPRTKK